VYQQRSYCAEISQQERENSKTLPFTFGPPHFSSVVQRVSRPFVRVTYAYMLWNGGLLGHDMTRGSGDRGKMIRCRKQLVTLSPKPPFTLSVSSLKYLLFPFTNADAVDPAPRLELCYFFRARHQTERRQIIFTLGKILISMQRSERTTTEK
jgi:hypothetical protein